MVTAFIGLGANLENPRQQLLQAIETLSLVPACKCLAISSLYRSKPMGPQNQPDYVNAVMSMETNLSPLELLERLQLIEQQQGRLRGDERWGPRTLDLDILLYGGEVIDELRLKIPHSGLHERSFVLYPLHEIAPTLVIPNRGALKQLLDHCEYDLEVISDES